MLKNSTSSSEFLSSIAILAQEFNQLFRILEFDLLRYGGVWFISTSSNGHSPGGVCFHFYDFKRTLCCCGAAASSFGGVCFHFYNFRRTLRYCYAAQSGSFLRLLEDALLLRFVGLWFISTISGGRSAVAVQRRLVHFYDFRRTLCCCGAAASAFIYELTRTLCCGGAAAFAFISTSLSERSAVAVRRALVHFYIFRRTLCCCGAAAPSSFLRLQADALLLRCGGVCFHFYVFKCHKADALLLRCGGV